jgi:hypothetical protein
MFALSVPIGATSNKQLMRVVTCYGSSPARTSHETPGLGSLSRKDDVTGVCRTGRSSGL